MEENYSVVVGLENIYGQLNDKELQENLSSFLPQLPGMYVLVNCDMFSGEIECVLVSTLCLYAPEFTGHFNFLHILLFCPISLGHHTLFHS